MEMSPFIDDPKLWAAHEPGVRALARHLLGDIQRRLGLTCSSIETAEATTLSLFRSS